MNKLCIGIVCGGCSKEHEISLKSATYIAKSIDSSIFEIVILWIDKQGNWYVLNNKNINFNSCDINQYIPVSFNQCSNKFNFCCNNNENIKIDVVFPIIHGGHGEDGSMQGFLRIINLPYVGSDVLGSAICMNKDVAKSLLRDAGLPIISFKTISIHERNTVNFIDFIKDLGLPLCVKPVDQGSSIGISKVDNDKDFFQALDIAFSYSKKIIVEPFVIGRELECGILGNCNPITSVCGEIILRNNNFYTYNDKYIFRDDQIIIPALIDKLTNDKIRYIAVQAFKTLHCADMARISLFLTLDGQIIINEINTIPGFSDNSIYPRLWSSTGLQIQLLLTKLIKLALDRYKNNYIY